MQLEPEALRGLNPTSDSQGNSWTTTGGKPTFELSLSPGSVSPGWHLVTSDLTTAQNEGQDLPEHPVITLKFLPKSGFASLDRKVVPVVAGRRTRIVHVPDGAVRVQLEISPWVDTVSITHVTLKPLPSALAASLMAADLGASSVSGLADGPDLISRLKNARNERGNRAAVAEVAHAYEKLQRARAGNTVDYQPWRNRNATMSERERATLIERCAALADGGPIISVVVPVYNPEVKWLEAAINSVIGQSYEKWQLCLVNDTSTDPAVRECLDKFAAVDERIVIHHRDDNGHIAAATNDGIERSTGEFVAFMDHDDALAPFALGAIALEASNADIIYTDEDKIDESGHHYGPHCKPRWNPELLLGQNYMSHLTAIRRSLIDDVGGLRTGFDGSQDHDLLLRATAKTAADRICHIPLVAYHWRAIAGSTALSPGEKTYTEQASIRALEDRLGTEWKVQLAGAPTAYRCTPPLDATPLVSIIIPTRDRLNLVTQCINSLAKTTYENYEVLILDNDSNEAETLEWFRSWDNSTDQRVIAAPGPFNFSAINNVGVRESNGELVMLLNNDTEVINPEWLTEMVRWISRPGVGIVGAKLLYPTDTIQHAGVVLGYGGFAGHGQTHEPADAPGYFNRLMLTHEAGAVTAACMLTKRSTWDLLGGLEEELSVAFNDIDYCLRVRHEIGERIIWTPEALLYHHESVSRGTEDDPIKVARFVGEVDFVMQRWADLLDDDPAYSPNLTLEDETFSLARQARFDPPWKTPR